MLKKLRTYILEFLSDSKHIPWLVGLSAGTYPFFKYYNSNFPLVDSKGHFVVFVLLFLLLPIFGSYLIKFTGAKLHVIKKHEALLFTLNNFIFFTLLVIISTWGVKKEYFLIGLIIASICSFLLKNHLKKAIVFQLLMAVLVVPKLIPDLYNHFLTKDNWKNLPDNLGAVKLIEKPNIYFVQPDGYVSKKTLENKVYQSSSDLYNWLENNDFKVYHDFRSNYSSSLVSNASMFSMKHHYFGETLFPALEMPRARSIINGDNNVIDILQNNGYKSYFIVEDEYFQQNFAKRRYYYQNIDLKTIPFFSSGENIKRDVFKDLETVINRDKNSVNPKFFFIEKLIPHHVHFKESKEVEHKDYLNKIDKANIWVKKITNLINEKDPNAIIIVAADHGGWVGLENYNDFHLTSDEFHVNSIFSTLCAIKWNKIDNLEYDKALKTNVNIFRVLFSALSKNSAYLNYLEEDGSYQLRKENKIGMSIYRLIDKNGLVVSEKLEK